MAAYASALNHVALAGPTLFGQVINNAAEIAGQSLSYNSCKYFVLLIITVERRMTSNCIYFYFILLLCRENLTSKLHLSLYSFFLFLFLFFLGTQIIYHLFRMEYLQISKKQKMLWSGHLICPYQF